jgi:hypothetical protein
MALAKGQRKRINTTVQSGGAETLVCAELMLRGIFTGHYVKGFYDVDVFCFSPQKRSKVINISVKYRHAASATFFPTKPIRKPVDFFVGIRGNAADGDLDDREIWVVPAAAMQKLEKYSWKRKHGIAIPISRMPGKYENAWGLIEAALG